MTGPEKTHPPDADPRPGQNAGYAEQQPRDKRDARQDVIPGRPSPDEPGLHHDPDAQPDSAADA
jgi:hypothetical protein